MINAFLNYPFLTLSLTLKLFSDPNPNPNDPNRLCSL